ncbi:MAG: DUF2007 domain-containing protein [Anaerolineae bacterium]|nr:DUF2007 domain-containing protein [Anaerolineae bacterium]
MSPQSKNNKTGLAVVATVSGMMRAEILKSLLQDAGIQAILDYESAGVVFGITMDGLKLSQVRILVQEQYAEQAKQLLDAPLAPGWEEEAESS